MMRQSDCTTKVSRKAAGVLTASLLLLIQLPAVGAPTADALSESYGRGVHAYFGGRYDQAEQDLSRAIDGGTQDPRCYYFRALVLLKLGRQDDAVTDMQTGAKLEAQDSDHFYPINKSLERVQGQSRLMLQKYRRQARSEAHQAESDRVARRYEQLRQNERDALRRRVNVPLENLTTSSTSVPAVELPSPSDKQAEEKTTPPESPTASSDATRPAVSPENQIKADEMAGLLLRVTGVDRLFEAGSNLQNSISGGIESARQTAAAVGGAPGGALPGGAVPGAGPAGGTNPFDKPPGANPFENPAGGANPFDEAPSGAPKAGPQEAGTAPRGSQQPNQPSSPRSGTTTLPGGAQSADLDFFGAGPSTSGATTPVPGNRPPAQVRPPAGQRRPPAPGAADRNATSPSKQPTPDRNATSPSKQPAPGQDDPFADDAPAKKGPAKNEPAESGDSKNGPQETDDPFSNDQPTNKPAEGQDDGDPFTQCDGGRRFLLV